YLFSMLGPFASLTVSQLPRAIDSFNQGKIIQGTEQMLPALLRAPVTAYRYSKEGATTPTGAVIKEANEFTTGQLIAQGMGFAPEGLVAQRETIFKANELMMQVKNEKRKLMSRLDLEMRQEDSDVEKVLEDITKFNRKNWFDAIDADTITSSLKARMKKRLETERGLQIDEKYYPVLRQLFDVPIEKLEKEAERAK
ncbi:MAG: hypothetical protein EB103_07170, partial [Actinobacteria bacterium]|nr:hypothetical protein [Actinomycetota bacterium]